MSIDEHMNVNDMPLLEFVPSYSESIEIQEDISCLRRMHENTERVVLLRAGVLTEETRIIH